VSIGSQELSLTLRDWITDLAMVLFFFVAGLEIKREVTQGELRDPKQAALPVIAAFGGMIVPAAIFAMVNAGGSGSSSGGGVCASTTRDNIDAASSAMNTAGARRLKGLIRHRHYQGSRALKMALLAVSIAARGLLGIAGLRMGAGHEK